MRRWLTAVALGGVAAMALTGCAKPGGVDGNLTDDWAAIGEVKAFVPEAGTCHTHPQDIGFLSVYNPVDCGQPHRVETLHIGTFTGEDASRTTSPPAGSPTLHTAWKECTAKTNELVGGDWRGARLGLAVVLPSPQAWTGGARWFRCDVSETESVDDDSQVSRTGSLKGALSAPSDLALGCFSPKLVNDHVDEMTPVACTAKHRSEFAGVWDAPDTTYDAFDKDDAHVQQGCLGVIAAFAKVPNDGDIRYRVGWISYNPRKEEWDAGDRGVQCFLWLSSRDLTRSLKGAGTKGLPINYR
jgi:hypothetical protein